MKLLRAGLDRFLFEVGKREKRLLMEVLKLYSVIPLTQRELSRTADPGEAGTAQALLDEALSERRRQNAARIVDVLNDADRFREVGNEYQFMLTSAQLEWLLQVLNEIRVESWRLLGEPDPGRGKAPVLKDSNARFYAAMEFCGYFQMQLLAAIEGRT